MYGSILINRYWDLAITTSMLLWLLSKEEGVKLYGLTNVGLYVYTYLFTHQGYDCMYKSQWTLLAIFVVYFRDPKCLCLDNIEGFILNVPTEYKLGFVLLPLKRRHWIALKKIHGAFYNLDSKLDSPQLIGKVIKQTKFC